MCSDARLHWSRFCSRLRLVQAARRGRATVPCRLGVCRVSPRPAPLPPPPPPPSETRRELKSPAQARHACQQPAARGVQTGESCPRMGSRTAKTGAGSRGSTELIQFIFKILRRSNLNPQLFRFNLWVKLPKYLRQHIRLWFEKLSVGYIIFMNTEAPPGQLQAPGRGGAAPHRK